MQMATTAQAVLFTIIIVLGTISGVLASAVGMTQDISAKLRIPLLLVGLPTMALGIPLMMHLPGLYP